jgi:hypothetical protein
MSFYSAFQWYHSHADPIWRDGTFKSVAGVMKSMKIQDYAYIASVNDTGNNLSPVTTTQAIIYRHCR